MLWNWDLRISESDSSYLASDSARSVSRRIWLGRYFEPCHHSFPPCCNAPSLTASPPLALPFKAPHGRRRLSHPQPLTHAKTTMVSQHGCHLHPPWPSFRAAGGETTCRETQKTGEENMENNSSFNSDKNDQNYFFLFFEMRPLENTKNTKNKNHPLSQTHFQYFFCFQTHFQCFLFSRTENSNQTSPYFHVFCLENRKLRNENVVFFLLLYFLWNQTEG